MVDFPFASAIRTVREGMSARAGLAAFRAAGGAVTDAVWYRMVSEAKTTVAARVGELSAPLDRRPTAGEATRWTTVNAAGWAQQVEVIVRDVGTSEIRTIPFTVTGSKPITRQAAIDKALQTYSPDSGSGGNEVILGAVYVNSIIMEPGSPQ